jgi:hypothetical protein
MNVIWYYFEVLLYFHFSLFFENGQFLLFFVISEPLFTRFLVKYDQIKDIQSG